MQMYLQKLVSFANFASLLFLVLLPIVFCTSSHEQTGRFSNHSSIKHNTHKLNSQMTFDITLHGLLLWVSMGLIMPLGILTIRMSGQVECGRKLRVLFYIHLILQILAVLLATAGAVMSLKKFENSFDNNHQRIGLALYVAIWVQALIGLCRRNRGSKARRVWYFLHWLLGTAISLVGIINIYTGLKAYHKKTSKSIWLWTILFTAEVSLMAFLYLFQDKWEYMQKQGVILGINEAVTLTPSHQVDPQNHNQKLVLFTEPYKKRNALGNYLK